MSASWPRKEFDEERDAIVRALTGMIFSYDQNGHLMLCRTDIDVLVGAVDLLKRATQRRVILSKA